MSFDNSNNNEHFVILIAEKNIALSVTFIQQAKII